ncbi:MAG: ATP-dependent metallopeptidase FtsH/Yme1/Tma family protein, partial [Chloroflexi bacterium]|nr:ATP-dependent metallopeptidase FtsH/Yme1/Tma family protein [Chloroflexota bacterium]
MKPKWWQGGLFYLLILVAILALAFSFLPTSKKPEKVDFYAFVEQAKQGEIDTIQQDGTTLIGLKDDERKIEASFVGSTKELMDTLKEAGITLGEGGVKFNVKTGGFDWGGILISFVPLLLFGALLFFLFRSARGAN